MAIRASAEPLLHCKLRRLQNPEKNLSHASAGCCWSRTLMCSTVPATAVAKPRQTSRTAPKSASSASARWTKVRTMRCHKSSGSSTASAPSAEQPFPASGNRVVGATVASSPSRSPGGQRRAGAETERSGHSSRILAVVRVPAGDKAVPPDTRQSTILQRRRRQVWACVCGGRVSLSFRSPRNFCVPIVIRRWTVDGNCK